MSAQPVTASPMRINFVQGVHQAIDEAMAADSSVIILGEDIADPQGGGVLKATEGFSGRYGSERVRSTPISEQAIIGAAIGAALGGLRPIAEIMLMNFTTVAMDQIVNHAAKLRFMSGGQTGVPITIRTVGGGGWGLGGQHSDMLEAWFCHVAGLKVVVPSCPADAKGLLLSAIFDDDPVLFVESLPLYYAQGPAPAPGLRLPLGKAHVAREGNDVTLIGYGRAVSDLLAVAAHLEKESISAEVVDLRTVSPLDDVTILQSVAKTRRAVVVHEAVRPFGVGAEVSSRIHEALFDELLAPVQRVASQFTPVPFSGPLERAFLYNQQQVDAAVRKTLNRA